MPSIQSVPKQYLLNGLFVTILTGLQTVGIAQVFNVVSLSGDNNIKTSCEP